MYIYLLDRGSSASLNPSPRKENEIISRAMASAGKRVAKGEAKIAWEPSCIIVPQLGVGGLIPIPM